MQNDLKYTEASFSSILTYSLTLQVAQAYRSPILTIFVRTTMTTDIQTDYFTPCACVRGNNYIATLDNTCNHYYPLTAIPRYTAGVTAIKQYTYSDSAVVEIECPFQLGRLRELYEFSWDGVLAPNDIQPITNDTVGVYWLAEEYNRTLHVNVSAVAASPLMMMQFQCVGKVQTCQGSSLCQKMERNSPTITITTTAGMHVHMVMQ